jgi:ferredoxin
MFCGECVEVCPYDALEQTDFFELAGFDRTALAGEALYVRDGRHVDLLRETVPDLVPHVSDVLAGRGWEWTPIKAEDVAPDDAAPAGGNGKPVGEPAAATAAPGGDGSEPTGAEVE